MKKHISPKHQWTKEEIKRLISLWEDKTKLELAEEMDLKPQQIMYMAKRIRDAGFPLPKKTAHGKLDGLVKEAIAEIRGGKKSR